MKFLSFLCCLVLLFCGAQIAFGMTSTNYQIKWDSLNQGGDDQSSSTNYQMLTTIGEPIAGSATSTNYGLQAGYRAGDDATSLSLTMKTQSSGVEVSYTAFSNAPSTYVQVSSVASFSPGDYIAVVEDKGFSQLVAVGQIETIAGDIVVVDKWDGDNVLMSSPPSGGDDFVYKLAGTNFSFGTLAVGSQHTSLVMSSVQTTVSSYTVYVSSVTELANSSFTHTMTPVTDGAVSVGSEEYGAEAIGDLAVNPGVDMGVTTTLRAIQTRSVPTGESIDRIALLYKLSITSSTTAGAYSQDAYYTLTKNY